MSDKKPRYITTTLPYVNSDPHIGFGAELLRADALARFWRLMGHEVFFNTGTDEHGQKIYENAQKAGEPVQAYVDRYADEFKRLIPALGITPDINFIRTTDEHHVSAAQEIWRRCSASGDIYKKEQAINYCIGCELEKTDSELVDGRCPLHPNKDLEIRSEENYFFRFSKYQDQLLDLYKRNPEYVVPDFRLKEITTFVEGGLHDFSVSRLKEKMPWGVPVPDDETQVMYVWFDALTSYISALGWPEDIEGNYHKFWEEGITVQVAGKDNLRQQSAIWQAMLLSAGLPTTNQIMIGGFINSGGQKMSKSLGNVISPYELIERYGTDATRYLLLRHVHPFDDSDVTWERLDEWYTAGLVNGLGNVVARVMKMSETHLEPEDFPRLDPTTLDVPETFNLQAGCDHIWALIARVDAVIAETEPFKLIKTEPEQAKAVIANLRADLLHIGRLLLPIMPDTSVTIRAAVRANKKPDNLFGRLES